MAALADKYGYDVCIIYYGSSMGSISKSNTHSVSRK